MSSDVDQDVPPPDAAPKLDEDAVLSAYSRWAPIYDAVFAVPFFTGRRAVASMINALPAGRVLEAGVGTGMVLPLYKAKHRILGIDLSTPMLDRARSRVARRALTQVEALREMDASHLDFDDHSFDAVTAMYVMTVVPDPERVLSEFARVTKPGGRVVMIGHFASAGGLYAFVERKLARYASRIGWNPDVPVARMTRHPLLRLRRSRRLGPLWLFSLLEFERI